MASDTGILSDEALILRSKKGDHKAFGQLIERYQDQVYTLARRTLVHPHRADDIAQETFIRAWKAIARFEEKARFSSWLYRITLNSCLSELRKRKKPIDTYASDELDARNLLGNASATFDIAMEKKDLVDRMMAELPPVYRAMVVLHYVEGFGCQEIASMLGHPVGTVKAYLHRARAQLRNSAEQLLKTRSPSK